MSQFQSPFSLINFGEDRQLTASELESAIRFAICLEHEATSIYKVIAEHSGISSVRKVFESIADEEIIHVGELIRLLYKISKKEQTLYQKGFKEVEDILKGD